MKYIVLPIFHEIGFDEKPNETSNELLQRARIIKLACFYGIDWCTNRAQTLYREWMTNKVENLYVYK